VSERVRSGNGASWFETRGFAALLTMRNPDLILRRRESAVSKDEARTRAERTFRHGLN